MPRALFITFSTLLLSLIAYSQELNCQVQVISQKTQTADQQIFKDMENQIREFMNNRKWTKDVFDNQERIECSMLINITEEFSINKFGAKVSIQSSRPAFNSSYNTVLLNYVDNDWVFEYEQFQPLIWNENQFTSNLTSMLAYYAYVIIGLDYDSYSPSGGTPYFQKAQTIIDQIPSNLSSNDAPGWKPFDGQMNRYWFVENMLNTRYENFRSMMYEYHLQGIDVMYETPKVGATKILSALDKLKPIVEQNPNLMIINLFFNAKGDELVNLFAGTAPTEKTKAIQLLYKLDPTNSAKYTGIIKQ